MPLQLKGKRGSRSTHPFIRNTEFTYSIRANHLWKYQNINPSQSPINILCINTPSKQASIHLQCRRTWVQFLGQKTHWRRDRLLAPVFLGFPGGSAGKEYACNAGDLGLVPGLGRSPGEGKGYPLQYSGLENSMEKGAWRVAKSRIQCFYNAFELWCWGRHLTVPWTARRSISQS